MFHIAKGICTDIYHTNSTFLCLETSTKVFAVCGDSVAVCGDSRWVTGPCHVTCHATCHVTYHVNCHRLGQVTRVTSLSLSYVTQYITQGNAQYCKEGFCDFGHFDIVSTWTLCHLSGFGSFM